MTKLVSTCHFKVAPGLQLISYSLSSTDHRNICPNRLSLLSMLRSRYAFNTTIECA